MITKEKKNTEEKIMSAAEDVFMKEGFSGARMQTIADKAGINKSLLHYYFRSKQKMFYAVFRRLAPKIFPEILNVLQEDMTIFKKIEKFIYGYIDVISKRNKMLPLFIISELARNPESIAIAMEETLTSLNFNLIEKFSMEIKQEIESGNMRPIDPRQLFVNIVSLSVFPFIGKPIIMRIGKFDNKEFDEFIKQRKKLVAEFVINSIKIDR